MLSIADLTKEIPSIESMTTVDGRVIGIKGQTILAKLPQARLGDICSVSLAEGKKTFAQIVSFDENVIYLAPFSDIRGIEPGSKVHKEQAKFAVKIPDVSGGLVIDALGNILKTLSPATGKTKEIGLKVFNTAPNPLSRKPVNRKLITGVKSIDTLCSIGYGQRLGLFAAAGVGKSTLLGMLARGADVDVTVIALTGERGREVLEFIEHSLGEEGLKKSIVVVATSDQPAMQRSMAALTATAIAEHFRSQGKNVLLLVDSLTRMARAIRDVSLAAGELPIRQGLTSSVYSELPKLIERAGNDQNGSITAIYTLLDSSEYEHDPLSEEVKSLLDGHICLDNQVASKGIRPAVDFTHSISRCAGNLLNHNELEYKNILIAAISKLKKEKDLITMGGIPDSELKAAMAIEKDIVNFLNQTVNDKFSNFESSLQLTELVDNYLSLVKEYSLPNQSERISD